MFDKQLIKEIDDAVGSVFSLSNITTNELFQKRFIQASKTKYHEF